TPGAGGGSSLPLLRQRHRLLTLGVEVFDHRRGRPDAHDLVPPLHGIAFRRQQDLLSVHKIRRFAPVGQRRRVAVEFQRSGRGWWRRWWWRWRRRLYRTNEGPRLDDRLRGGQLRQFLLRRRGELEQVPAAARRRHLLHLGEQLQVQGRVDL